MRFKKLSGWILMVVLLTAALVLAGGGAALANKHYVDDINDLHCDGDDNCDVPLSESKVAGGELKSGDTIVLDFSENELQTQSVIVDIENVTIRGAHGPSGTTVYAGDGFVGSDGGNSTMFEIRRGGVTLEGFRMTSYEEEDNELESAVLVTAADVGCLQNSGKNLTFENLTVAESAYSEDKGGGGSNLINRAFHFKTCCHDYDNVTFLDVTIGELGTADPENGTFVAGIHFEANDDDFPDDDDDDYDDRYAYSVKNSTFENVSIGDSTGVQGPGILFENGGDLENIVVSDSVIGEDNSGHGIEVRSAEDGDVGDIDGFKIVDSSIISNGGSGVWIGEYSEDGEEYEQIEDVDGLLIKDSELNDHSSGYGLFIFADSVSNLEFNNAEAYNNDEGGVFVNTVGDIIDVRILNESLFEGNGGHGVLLFPADDTSSSLLSSSDSEWGLEVRDSSFVNNEDCGLLVEATKHIRDVKVEGSMDNEDTAY
ncbi:MAG: right-handed parallel beta-helix repeat-containing protein, partial [Candidatus Bipolaricaulota bacterium]